MDNLELVFKGLNVYQAAIVVLRGFVDISAGSLKSFVQGFFLLAFGSVIGALELTEVTNAMAQKYASFLFSFIGRGVFSIFLGSLVMGSKAISFIAGLSLMLIGVVYIALAFVPSIDPPANMRDTNDALEDDEIEGIV